MAAFTSEAVTWPLHDRYMTVTSRDGVHIRGRAPASEDSPLSALTALALARRPHPSSIVHAAVRDALRALFRLFRQSNSMCDSLVSLEFVKQPYDPKAAGEKADQPHTRRQRALAVMRATNYVQVRL